ncbi:NAD+ synthase (glutamine-hydrolysing) [Saprolegnia diclina VS20]|uniref:Glutamine-dependent NAD(+) synthetase n=2 Tax=Saprolegnia TaxID=4769 RepID=T0R1C1_SAPDV|nr:NAD+ synthase (glutamine-hydrolysing) [Saprolegnia diclina VS20]EQC40110.1 NAD+ synthase (glutamine-hydrolysing) [Saprolegnia diclina VS20]|eukprot:XP_008606584.1 NAD+ synthase (glutamine-hydrolysing) [Saprolegnia diclina VS20]
MNMNAPLLTVATCNLNQWALDFDGNLERIMSSIRIAKARGATYRLGPELEICGYGCEDHFLEADTFFHCWESMATLLSSDVTDGILCDIGMPVMHGGVRYNCRVFCLDRKILFIRPKLFHADDGNYRETRWFTTWKIHADAALNLQSHMLPLSIQELTSQVEVPFGIGAIATRDSLISSETCEELFTPDAPHISLSLGGVEIIGNGSGSHHELRKLHHRIDLIRGATAKAGGIYLYANQQGCDGGRLYYDGCALIVVNGHIVAQGSQFSVNDIEVITAVVDLDDVRSYRGACSSRSEQASAPSERALPHINVNFRVCPPTSTTAFLAPSPRVDFKFHAPEEEIALGPACWMWDYLRRSKAKGFFLPLSGGADSASVACIVGVMCHLATAAGNAGDIQVQKDILYLLGKDATATYESLTPQELASHILHTTYMGTENSSLATETRAKTLAAEIGNYHLTVKIDAMVSAVVSTFALLVGKTPRFGVHGGTASEDLALQNIQARLRMVMAYLLAQLLPWVRSKAGFLLVLGSANVDEALRGYMTKYDCSSADLNPIGAVSKTDLKRLLVYAAKKYNYPTLATVVAAPPTAELRPMASGADEEHSQIDEEDMGMTYEELGWFGRLRKIDRCGPLWMFRKLSHVWTQLTPTEVAAKVKRFFFYYGINRHKMTTLTPSYHAENYSPDDNRFDLRPFLYNSSWSRQFKSIDTMASAMDAQKAKTD